MKIPDALQFSFDYNLESHDEGGYLGLDEDEIKEMLINFAKLHVKAALKAALNNAEIISEWNTGFSGSAAYVKSESILNAYPLENIK